jgi:uncharacterized tellurite resistance protein B-like protein
MVGIAELSVEQRRAFLAALLYIATIDDEFHPTEREFVQRTMEASQLPEEDRAAVLKTLEVRPPIDEILRPLVGTPTAKLLVRELVSLAYVDGAYVGSERSGVAAIAAKLGLQRDWLATVEAWVADGIAWHQRGQALLAVDVAASS